MAFDPKQFTDSITAGLTIDPAKRAQLEAILADPALQPKFAELQEGNLRQSDYSKKIKAAQDYWDGLVQWDKDAKASLAKEQAALRAQLDPAAATVVQPNGVSKDDLQKLAQEYLAYNSAITKIGLQHLKEFGEVLDPNDLLKVSAENGGININLSYDKFVQPKRDELQKKHMDDAIAKAREEGKAEALSNIQIPTNETPFSTANTQLDNLMKRPEGQAAPEYGTLAAIKAWKESRAKGGVPAGF